MFGNKEILKLQEKIEELSEKIEKISERQNTQFTDIMLQLKETKDEIIDARESRAEFDYGDMEGTDDELYEQVKELVVSSKKASTSYLQRIFGIGYSRAANLMDTLENEKVIGPANGAKPREVYAVIVEE